MSKPMAIATISGKKTKTRRLSGLDSINDDGNRWKFSNMELNPKEFFGDPDHEEPKEKTLKGNYAVFYNDEMANFIKCPYGKPGDRIFVRENFRMTNWDFEDGMVELQFQDEEKVEFYSNDGDADMEVWGYNQCNKLAKKGVLKDIREEERMEWVPDKKNPWIPSIHLPKWGSRLWLEIEDITIERLQKISPEDAIAEGIISAYQPLFSETRYKDYLDPSPDKMWRDPVSSFKSLWGSIHGQDAWKANPFVWVITFKVIDNPHTPE